METRVTPIAVIGMGCRLPGGIDSPDMLWEALLRGDDLVTDAADRWDADEFIDPEPGVPGRTVSRWEGSSTTSRASTLSSSGSASGRRSRSIRSTDCCWKPRGRRWSRPVWIQGRWPGRRQPCSFGSVTQDYLVLTIGAGALVGPHAVTGVNNSVASGRIALGLHGPAMTSTPRARQV